MFVMEVFMICALSRLVKLHNADCDEQKGPAYSRTACDK